MAAYLKTKLCFFSVVCLMFPLVEMNLTHWKLMLIICCALNGRVNTHDFSALNRGIDTNTCLKKKKDTLSIPPRWNWPILIAISIHYVIRLCDYIFLHIFYCLYSLFTFCHVFFFMFYHRSADSFPLFSPLPPFAEVAVPAVTLTK